ncbi:hypothetical protein B0H13DRAFT_2679454 [Mycena leptocephala]|nr:hypothetical protein B0H13DRAFT_2679454 [Mycena leptocephala]
MSCKSRRNPFEDARDRREAQDQHTEMTVHWVRISTLRRQRTGHLHILSSLRIGTIARAYRPVSQHRASRHEEKHTSAGQLVYVARRLISAPPSASTSTRPTSHVPHPVLIGPRLRVSSTLWLCARPKASHAPRATSTSASERLRRSFVLYTSTKFVFQTISGVQVASATEGPLWPKKAASHSKVRARSPRALSPLIPIRIVARLNDPALILRRNAGGTPSPPPHRLPTALIPIIAPPTMTPPSFCTVAHAGSSTGYTPSARLRTLIAIAKQVEPRTRTRPLARAAL